MTKNEIKGITKKWFFSKDFQKADTNTKEFAGLSGATCYIYVLSNFFLYVLFDKDRFSEKFEIIVGFKLKDNYHTGWGNINTRIPNFLKGKYTAIHKKKIYGYKYEEWEKEDYLACLEMIYDIYIKPYFELGIDLLKIIAKDPSCGGKFGATKEFPYFIHPDAVDKILRM